jgi:PAS domain S-box-containing protein
MWSETLSPPPFDQHKTCCFPDYELTWCILNDAAQPLAGYPRKLLLLSSDSKEESVIRQSLSKAEDGKYELFRIENFADLEKMDVEHSCHAILLDMRIETNQVLDTIQSISEVNGAVALICLCRNHAQLREYKDIIHLVDDYLLAESLVEGELPTRISHTIRRCHKEEQLLEEQNLLKQLLENIPDSIYFKDTQSRFIKVSKAMNQIYGFTDPVAILGKTDFDIFTTEHAQPAYDDEQAIIQTGKPIIAKLEKETLPDGRINWVSTTKVPLRDTHNQIIGTMGMSRVVTELKQAQDQLEREGRLLKTVIDYALAGIFVKDTQGRYLIVNQRHADYLGASTVEEVNGKTLHDYFDAPEATRISINDAKIMKTGKGIEYMVDHRISLNNRDLWLLTSKVPFYDKDGACIGLVGISQDITGQKEIELKLKSTIQTLKTTQLQLIEAEKLKTVGRLAAGVAHEVKNPLAVVTLGMDFLKQQLADSTDLVQVLNDMQTATTKANNVIFELLDYSSPHEISMVPKNLNELIEHVLSFMRHNFNEAQVELQLDLSPNLPLVSMDTQKMEQVFINLFLNAISVMPEGGQLIIRSFKQRMQQAGSNVSSKMTESFRIGDHLAVIEVKDTGGGLSPEALDKVFDPFYSSKSTGDGTGLGLSVTQSIVDIHHGLITLDNRTTTQGVCARLTFPTTSDHENT